MKDLEPADFSREEVTRWYMERMGAWMQAPAETEGQRNGAYVGRYCGRTLGRSVRLIDSGREGDA